MPSVHFVALKHLFLFRKVQIFRVFIEASAVRQTRCWSRQHQQVCHFCLHFLSDSHSVLAVFYSPEHLSETIHLIPCLYYQATVGPQSLIFFLVMTRPMSLSDQVSSFSQLQPLVVSLHSSLFLDWGRIVSSKFFHAKLHFVSIKEILLPRHARCVLSRLRSIGYSFLYNVISL